MDQNVLELGARSGDSLQTRAFQEAIDRCFLTGGGRVCVPAGIYRLGTLRLRSNVELYLCAGAYLEASRDTGDYCGWENDALEPTDPGQYARRDPSTNPFSRWSHALIKAFRAENIAVTGEPGSFLDGMDCVDPDGEEGYRGPHLMNFHECRGVTLRGYTARRSANWAHAIFHSSDILIDGITVYGGHDGIDVRSCDRITVQNCHLVTGDDCVAGYDNLDLQIRNCDCESSCQLFRLGGRRILIENIRSTAPAGYGFRGSLTPEERLSGAPTHPDSRHRTRTPFLYFCDFRATPREQPGDILVRNCRFENANSFFWMPYGEQKWCVNKPLAQIEFENCQFMGLSDRALIHGGEEAPIHMTLRRCTLSPRPGFEGMLLADLARFARLELEAVQLQGFTDPAVVTDGSGVVETGGCPLAVRTKDN